MMSITRRVGLLALLLCAFSGAALAEEAAPAPSPEATPAAEPVARES